MVLSLLRAKPNEFMQISHLRLNILDRSPINILDTSLDKL